MKRNTGFGSHLLAALALAIIALLLSPPHLTEAREFTSTDGKKIQAEVIKVTPKAVVLVSRGNNFTVPLNRLSEEDRTFLNQWAENEKKNRIPKVDIKINSNKRDRREDNAYEDRRGEFKFEIFIENDERGFDISKATGTLVVLGKYLYERDEGIVMERKEFRNIDIPESESTKLEGSLVKFEYDKSGYTHGQKYDGYLFIFKTAGGKVIKTVGSTSRVEKAAATILKLKNGDRFDEDTFLKIGTSETRR